MFGTHSWEHEAGAALYFRPGQCGCVLSVPGETWDVVDDWLTLVAMHGGRVTRLDVARDLGPAEDARGRMVAMRREWKRGRVGTEIRTFEEARSEEGWTWYFGGRTAEVRLRVYDRRGPLRLEFQWRPNDKDALLAHAATDPDAIWRMLAKRIEFPLSWYRDLLRGDAAMFEVQPAPTDYERAALALREQWVEALWAFVQLGMTAESFAAGPECGRLRSATKSKFKRWAFQAGDKGKRLLEALESR